MHQLYVCIYPSFGDFLSASILQLTCFPWARCSSVLNATTYGRPVISIFQMRKWRFWKTFRRLNNFSEITKLFSDGGGIGTWVVWFLSSQLSVIIQMLASKGFWADLCQPLQLHILPGEHPLSGAWTQALDKLAHFKVLSMLSLPRFFSPPNPLSACSHTLCPFRWSSKLCPAPIF